MDTVTYKSVLDKIGGYFGQNAGLSVEDSGLANRLVNTRYKGAFEFYFWPDFLLTEKRQFRPSWNANINYKPGDEVYYRTTQKYYCALTGNFQTPPADATGAVTLTSWAESQPAYGGANYDPATTYVQGNQVYFPDTDTFYQCIAVTATGIPPSGNPPFDVTTWGALKAFVRSIPFKTPTGPTANYTGWTLTGIGAVKKIWDRDPEANTDAISVPFQVKGSYLLVRGRTPTVWVEFRIKPNSFSGPNWSATGSYNIGDQVYYGVTGEYYQCLAAASGPLPTDTAHWVKLDFPYIFQEYVAQSVYGTMAAKEEQMPEDLAVEVASGFPFLLLELQKIERQQGQARQLNMINTRST